jgi:hypothetical protein
MLVHCSIVICHLTRLSPARALYTLRIFRHPIQRDGEIPLGGSTVHLQVDRGSRRHRADSIPERPAIDVLAIQGNDHIVLL